MQKTVAKIVNALVECNLGSSGSVKMKEKQVDRAVCLSVSLVACNLYFVALAINVLYIPCSNKSAFKAYKVVVQSETFVYLA